MQVGDLVKFVGHATFYKGRVGVIAQVYDQYPQRQRETAMVHFAGAEGQARDVDGLGQVNDGLHPMSFDELELV